VLKYGALSSNLIDSLMEYVCVAQRHFIYQGNEMHDKKERRLRPCLYGLSSESLGDPMTAGFVGFLMAHLDLAKAAKKILPAMYQPVTGAFKRELIVRLFGDEWHLVSYSVRFIISVLRKEQATTSKELQASM